MDKLKKCFSLNSVDISDDKLIEIIDKLNECQNKSYNPYSKFKVASIMLFNDDTLVGGQNIENASYPLCMCAERVAIYNAISQGKNLKQVKAICVACDGEEMFYPCGACRQVMVEFLNENCLVVVMKLKKGIVEKVDCALLSDLLPKSFKL